MKPPKESAFDRMRSAIEGQDAEDAARERASEAYARLETQVEEHRTRLSTAQLRLKGAVRRQDKAGAVIHARQIVESADFIRTYSGGLPECPEYDDACELLKENPSPNPEGQAWLAREEAWRRDSLRRAWIYGILVVVASFAGGMVLLAALRYLGIAV